MTPSMLRFTGFAFATTMWLACAASTVEVEDDGAGAQPPTTTAGGADQGGAGGAGLPCGIDCGTIQTSDCQQAVCNEALGQCEIVDRAAGSPCDDGLFCTVDDACDAAGICVGGPQNDCGMGPGDCDEVTCDEASKTCSLSGLPNGSACTNSQDLCQLDGACQNGECVGTLKDCFFQPVPDECHVSECNPTTGMCEPVPGNDGADCVDPNDLCSLGNTCAGGVCAGGIQKDCSILSADCVLGVCDPGTGECMAQNLMNGDLCDDQNACTTGETCQNGACGSGTPITACVNADGCCPSACTISNDSDCVLVTLDVGPFASSYNSSTATRGYWFTAPVSFTIKELRVPTDVGTTVQNIQVVKFTGGPPPNFASSTTAHTTLHYSTTTTGSNWVTVNIPVAAGETVGILGARGTSTMSSSYGATTPYATTIFSQPVNLHRLVYQANVRTTPAGALSNEPSGAIGRVEMRYGP